LAFGVKDIKTDYVLITDADLPIDTEDYVKIFHKIEEGYDIVVANRRHKDSKTDRPFMRRLSSNIFNIYVRVLFFIGIKDSQCGIKIFKTESLKRILPRFAKRYSMDVEMLYYAKKKKMKIEDVAVNYKHVADTNFSVLRDGPKMLLEILRLRISTFGKT